eukprot:UN29078
MTAIHLLGIYSLLSSLVQCDDPSKKKAANSLVSTYLINLPRRIKRFIEPSQRSLALFMLNSVTEIRQAATVLLEGVINRLSENGKKALIESWSKDYMKDQKRRNDHVHAIITSGNAHHHNNATVHHHHHRTSTELMLKALMLCMIEGYDSSLIDKGTAANIMTTLQLTLEDKVHCMTDVIRISLSCNYLTKVVDHWYNHINQHSTLFKKLLEYSGSDWGFLTKAARASLLMCGRSTALKFVEVMGDEATNSARTNGPQQALVAIATLTKKYPQCL